MWKRRVYFVIAVGLLGGFLIWVLRREREPAYGGKKLSGWVMAYAVYPPNYNKIDDAIRQIGTNGIPYLVKWITYEPTASKTKRLANISNLLRRLNSDWG